MGKSAAPFQAGVRKVSAAVQTARALTVLLVGGTTLLAGPVPQDVRRLMRSGDYRAGTWGLAVADLKTGEELCARGGDKLFVPASVTKLFTVGAALDELGADYRFRTPVYARNGPDAGGVLASPLVLLASGDVTLGGRTREDGSLAFTDSDHTYASFLDKVTLVDADPLAGLDDLARQIAAAGVTAIRGGVVVDARLFDEAKSSGSGPERVTSFVLNDNVIDFRITPGNEGDPAQVASRPRGEAIEVDAEVKTVAAGAENEIVVSRTGRDEYRVRGEVAAGAGPLVRIEEMEDPAALGAALFAERLRAAGVEVDDWDEAAVKEAMPGQAAGYAEWVKLAELVSPPFSENAKLILKVSHNLHASTLPLLLAVRHGERDFAAGMRLQGAFLREAGLERREVSFAGGAGGERADRVTPRAAVRFLRFMANHRDSAAYRAALPVLGVDGTLAEAVGPDSPVRGKVWAKTGTLVWSNGLDGRSLLNSKALAGYLEAASGRELVFAMFLNDVLVDDRAQAREAGKWLAKICEALAAEY